MYHRSIFGLLRSHSLEWMAGRKTKLGVLIPFHTDTDHPFAIPTVYPLNHNTVKKRMMKNLGMSFFGIINFPDFLSTCHSVRIPGW